MATNAISSQLRALETGSQNPQQRADSYNELLGSIISSSQGSDQASALVSYVRSILSDNIGVIHSKPLLTSFVNTYRGLSDNEVKVESGPEILQIVAPRTVSYEQQDTDLKLILADAYEADEDFANSAKTLQAIKLDSSQRVVSDNDKARVWMRICRCYLEENDHINAATYLNRIKQVIYNVTDHVIKLQFQLSQARISDSQRVFLDASIAYYTLSNETEIDEEERLQTLSAAMTCAVLAPAGPSRAKQLAKLCKDNRAAERPEHAIVEKIYLNRLLAPAEVAAFAATLQEHQLAKTSDGTTVLDKAVIEHNLVAVSRLYRNISVTNLGSLLGVDADRAETYAAAMIESGRLLGSIDQIDNIIYFGTENGSSDASLTNLKAWDAGVQGLAEEVEKVATLLQREEAQWYKAHIAAK